MKIALLGDIGIFGKYSVNGNLDIFDKLTEISNYLLKFDYVIGNLETPFSVDKQTNGAKSAYLCADANSISILKRLHIKAVSIANNHIFDYGEEGFKTTIQTLNNSNINWFGCDGVTYKIENKDGKILFNGFCCYSSNPLKIASKIGNHGVNGFNLKYCEDLLRKTANKGWLNIMAIHSGIEHVNYPSVDQIYASRQLSSIAPYIWYGHHPHVVQGIEIRNGAIIAHSLGNFCFDDIEADKSRPKVELSHNNRIGMILELNIEDNKIVGYNTTLIHIGSDGLIKVSDDNSPIKSYSEQISQADNNWDEYRENRIVQRREYLKKRIRQRNFQWVLKHLRLRYIKLFVSNRINAYKYKRNVVKYLRS